MDRYELTIKIEQLDKLVKNQDFVSAAKVAEQIDWKKMKQWTVMSNAIDAFVATEKYDKARNVCIYAYNRRLGGRRLLATLMDMYIRLGEYEDAEEIYREYVETAPRDLGRYTLLYKLKRAQGASVGELIDILQEYKENELDEAYEYELALLYSEAGLADRCVRECDELVLWFADGVYVEKALRLKQMYTPLTARQAEKLEKLERMSAMGVNSSDTVSEYTENEVWKNEKNEPEAADEEAGVGYDLSSEEPLEEPAEELTEEPAEETEWEPSQEPEPEEETGWAEPEEMQSEKPEPEAQAKENVKYIDNIGNTTEWSPIDVEEELQNPQGKEEPKASETTAAKPDMELIEDDYEINIKVPDYSVYDTRNVQQELKANVEEIMEAYHNREKQDELLEAQELAQAADNVEPTKEIIINKHQWRKASRNSANKAQDAPKQSSASKPQVLDDATKRLSFEGLTVEQMAAIVAKMQAEQQAKENADKEDDQIEGQMDITQWLSELEEEQQDNAAVNEAAVTIEKEPEDEAFEEIPDTEEPEDIAFEEIPDIEESEEETFEEELPDLEMAINAGIEKIIDDTVKNAIDDNRSAGEAGGYMLQPEERRFMEKYLYMSGMERRLCRYIGSLRNVSNDRNSSTGNVVIMGSRTTDKTAFAVNLFKALHAYDEKREQKLARISAEKINASGFESIRDRIAGQTLVIEKAGDLRREQISHMIEFMDSKTGGTLFILEDEEFSINKLFAENPDFAEKFTGRFLLKQYTVNELVDIAKDYADEQGWCIEDKALLKLYLILSKLPNDDQGNIVNIVNDIIKYAGEHAKNRLGNKLFGRFRSVLTIKESDFDIPDDEDEDEEGEYDDEADSGEKDYARDTYDDEDDDDYDDDEEDE